eukprot:COSAG04_NODE_1598_length_6200_cov_3.034584_2_plen_68_part_00
MRTQGLGRTDRAPMTEKATGPAAKSDVAARRCAAVRTGAKQARETQYSQPTGERRIELELPLERFLM